MKTLVKRILSTITAMSILVMGIPANQYIVHAAADANFNTSPTILNGRLVLPTPPAGYRVELFGTDRPQVVDLDGTITSPIVDVTVKLLYRLTSTTTPTDTVTTTRNATIAVPAKTTLPITRGSNTKPNIIPTIREWVGGDGNFTLTDATKIAYAAKDEAVLSKVANTFKADMLEITGKTLTIEKRDAPISGDIYLSISNTEPKLGTDGYYIVTDGGKAVISAPAKDGVYYGITSILQILKLDNAGYDTLPNGVIRDYPKSEIRGMSFDVARKYIPAEFLDEYIKQMSFYKMSDISLHLNDNEVFANPVVGGGTPFDFEQYSAFRLESKVPGLTATDGHYTKEKFKQMQLDAFDVGINIIPEFDAPGHSLAFTKARNDLAIKKTDGSQLLSKYLDVLNPNTLPFIKSVFSEYLDEGIFLGKYIHIGTDEYGTPRNNTAYGTRAALDEGFRKFTDEMIKFINSHDGKRAALWGALSMNNASSYAVDTDALMYGWYNGYANPNTMLAAGYDMVTLNDQDTYIVPGANPPVESGGYKEILDYEMLFNRWVANKFGGTVMPEAHPGIKGGMFAIWNDNIGNGISVDDIYKLSAFPIQIIAQKTWAGTESPNNYAEFKTLAEKLGDAPGTNLSNTVKTVGENNKIIEADFTTIANSATGGTTMTANGVTSVSGGKTGNAANFTTATNNIATNVSRVGFGWTASMWLNPSANNADNATLFESGTTKVKLKQGTTGKIGFSVENYDHYFDYVVPEGMWTNITMTGNHEGTSLYANGILVERLQSKRIPNSNYSHVKYYETLAFPLETIGSKTNSYKGKMDDLKVYNRVLTNDEIAALVGIIIDSSAATNVALGKTVVGVPAAVYGDRTSNKLVDGKNVEPGGNNMSNRWAPDNAGAANEYSTTIDLGESKNINKVIVYNPNEGRITNLKVEVKNTSDAAYTQVATATPATTDSITTSSGVIYKTPMTFTPVLARYVKITYTNNAHPGNSISVNEVEVYAVQSGRTALNQKYTDATALLSRAKTRFVDTTALEAAMVTALSVMTNSAATATQITDATTALTNAMTTINTALTNANLALNKTATASGTELDLARLAASGAFDGDRVTMQNGRWSSDYNPNAWIQVDLGQPRGIKDMEIYWEAAYAKGYKIEISDNGTTYKEIYRNTNSRGGHEIITLPKYENGRYLKLTCLERSSSTNRNISIMEWEVYGKSAPYRYVVEQIIPNKTSLDLKTTGSFTITTQVLPQFSDQTITFTSESPAVASVTAQGLVTALTQGNTNIVIRSNPTDNISVVIPVTVTNGVDKTALSALIDDIKNTVLKDEASYVPASFNSFIKVFDAAVSIKDNALIVRQSIVDGAVTDLQKAFDGLERDSLAPPAENRGAKPSPKQLQYHKDELAAFIHFGMNTFTNVEWGSGQESPDTFNPTVDNIDTDGWVKELQAAGFKKIIITAKHHDGFNIWQSAISEHGVKNSPWKNGRGDVLEDLSKSCTKYNMDMGLYLSPWDANNPNYGDNKGSDYNQVYMSQVREILSNSKYGNNGKFKEVWMDGAKGRGEEAQWYDLRAWYKLVYDLEGKDDVLLFNNIWPDVRWIGNESGFANDPIWMQVNRQKLWNDYWNASGTVEDGAYLASGDPNGADWALAEADVSIRPGWFFHQNETPKTGSQLMNIYIDTVGSGVPLLLNVPPNKAGAFELSDVRSLREFARIKDATFSKNLLSGATATASSVRGGATNIKYSPNNVLDDDYDSYWTMNDRQNTGTITIQLDQTQYLDIVEICEYIPLGQRISSYSVEAKVDGTWQPFGTGRTNGGGKTIGAKALVHGIPVNTDEIRISVLSSHAVPIINSVRAYKADKAIEKGGGSVPAPDGMILIDDRDMTGSGWTNATGGIKNTKSTASTANTTKTFTFTGTAFYLFADMGTAAGKLEMTIDGGTAIPLDLYAATNTASALAYTSNTLTNSSHTVVIKALGAKNASSTSNNVTIDGAYYLNNGAKGAFEIELPSYTLKETTNDTQGGTPGTVNVKIKRIGGSTGAATVQIDTIPGTAVQGRHYVHKSQNVNFAAGETEKTISFTAIDNDEANGDMFFYVSLSQYAGADPSFITSSIVNIKDNDFVIDKTALKTQLDTSNAITAQGNYTTATWTAFTTARSNAQAIYDKANATQTEVEDALNNLRTKHGQLDTNAISASNRVRLDAVKAVGVECEKLEVSGQTQLIHNTEHTGYSGNYGIKLRGDGTGEAKLYYNAPKAGIYEFVSRVDNQAANDVLLWKGNVTGTANTGTGTGLRTVVFTMTLQAGDGAVSFYGTVAPNIDRFTITYKDPITGISIAQGASTELKMGNNISLTAVVAPNNAINQNVTWVSATPSVVTVNRGSGRLTPVSVGTSIITATCVGDSTKTATITINVVINKETLLAKINEAQALSSALYTADSFARLTNQITVAQGVNTSTTATQIQVDTAVANLTAKIDALVPVANGVTVASNNMTLGFGSSRAIIVTVTPSNAANKNVTFTSGDTTIATVNDYGVVTAIKNGTTIITVASAANPTLTKTVTINVSSNKQALKNYLDDAKVFNTAHLSAEKLVEFNALVSSATTVYDTASSTQASVDDATSKLAVILSSKTVIKGNVTNDTTVDIFDALTALKISATVVTYDDTQHSGGDLDNNKIISVDEVSSILKYILFGIWS